MGNSFASDRTLILLIDISIFSSNISLFSVPFSLLTTFPDIETTDSGFSFSINLKFSFLFSITH